MDSFASGGGHSSGDRSGFGVAPALGPRLGSIPIAVQGDRGPLAVAGGSGGDIIDTSGALSPRERKGTEDSTLDLEEVQEITSNRGGSGGNAFGDRVIGNAPGSGRPEPMAGVARGRGVDWGNDVSGLSSENLGVSTHQGGNTSVATSFGGAEAVTPITAVTPIRADNMVASFEDSVIDSQPPGAGRTEPVVGFNSSLTSVGGPPAQQAKLTQLRPAHDMSLSSVSEQPPPRVVQPRPVADLSLSSVSDLGGWGMQRARPSEERGMASSSPRVEIGGGVTSEHESVNGVEAFSPRSASSIQDATPMRRQFPKDDSIDELVLEDP